MLAIFAAAVVYGVRMLTWFAPVLAIVLLPHLQSLAARWRRRATAETSAEADDDETALPPGRSWRITLVCATVAWMAFGLSPISAGILGGDARTPQQLYGGTVPVAATDYLRQNPPEGVVLGPQWWSDWLVREGPPGLEPFVTSNIHAVPPAVWRDYLRFSEKRSGWMEILDRYVIKTMVLDKAKQASHVRLMRQASNWRIVFEDKVALIAVRTAPPRLTPEAGPATESAQPPAQTPLEVTSKDQGSPQTR
jgi:hypothetical protein